VLALIFRVLACAAWAVSLPWQLSRRIAARVPTGTHLIVEVEGALDELAPPRRLWSLRRERRWTLQALREMVDAAAHDVRVGGLVLVIKSLRCGFATCASLRGVLSRARESGKRVVVHLPNGGGTKEAYVAAAADRVLLGPQASLAPVGFLSARRYVRGALDRAGVVPEVHARGRYKTAAEPFEQAVMSDAQREQVELVLDRLHQELLAALSGGRRVDEQRARALVDGAPYFGSDAVDAGLADALAYEDELPRAGAERDSGALVLRRADAYARSRSALRWPALGAPSVIGVVRVHGPIASSRGLPLRAVAFDERIVSAIRIARASPRVRGVVVYIDSPGGSAHASDRIRHELARLAADKPVVACLGDVAASGGYCVAVAAHQIVAHPTTITGSIGVVAARLALEPLLERIGIVTQSLQRGARARMLDPWLPLSDDDRRVVDHEVDRIYRSFLEVVARGRSRSVADIERVAEGRVWTGLDARDRGLVDSLGGFDDALQALRARIGAGADRLRPVVLKPPPRPVSWLDVRPAGATHALAQALEPVARSLGIDVGLLALCGERVLAWSPAAAALRA